MANEVYRKGTQEEQGESRVTRGLGIYREGGVEDLGDGFYAVSSRSAPKHAPHRHLVNLNEETCECGDSLYRNETCQHQIAATMDAAKKARFKKVSRFSGEWNANIPNFDALGGVA